MLNVRFSLVAALAIAINTPAVSAGEFDGAALRAALIPKTEVGADAFLATHPSYDGRGVVIAVFDTGVDPRAPGLAVTTTGERKVVDLIDASGSGDVDTSVVRRRADNGTLAGLGGRDLTLPADLVNPSGDFHLGLKRAAELFDEEIVKRLTDHEHADWQAGVTDRRARADRQPTAALRDARAKAPADRTRAELDLIARADALAALEDGYSTTAPGPSYDCVVWHDGAAWRVLVDTDRDADLADETVLRPYGVAGETLVFDDVSHATLGVQVYDEGKLLSLVTVSGSHGTHVAAIAAAHYPGEPARNGIAPGARILSIKIGDVRAGGSSYGPPEQRAVAAAARHGVDLVNASWGGSSVYQDGADNNARHYRTLVDRYGILAIVSAGNDGPALSSVGSAGGEASHILGVGAYVSSAMGAVLYNTLAATPELAVALQFTGRGPTKDGDMGVDVMAPGAAWASVAAESLEGNAMYNGTSMAAPSASGVAALVLSAAKQLKLDAAPARLRQALMLGAAPVPAEDRFTAGTGLVNAAGTLAKLQALQGIPAFNTFYDLAVTGGTYVASGRGYYLREPVVHPLRRRVAVTITPTWTEAVTNGERTAFEGDFELRPSAPWIEAPAAVHLSGGSVTFPLHLNLPVQPGLTGAQVDAYLAGHADLGPVFSIPLTLVQPLPEEAFVDHRYATTVELAPAATKRLFFQAPPGATVLRLRATHRAADPVARRFVIHGLTPAAASDKGRHEAINYNWFEPNETRVMDFPVAPGEVTEIAFNQYFYTTSPATLETEFEWIGLGLPDALVVVAPNEGWSPVALHPGTTREVAVATELKFAVRALLPEKTERLSLDERAALPGSPRQPDISRPPLLRQTFSLSFEKATQAALLGVADFDVSDQVGGGLMLAVHESGQVLLHGMGRQRQVIDFPPGKTTITRDFASWEAELLDFAESLPLRLASPLKDKPALPVSADLRDAIRQDSTKKLKLDAGREAIIYLQDSARDDLAKLKPAPDYVIGELTFKDLEDRTLATRPLLYVLGDSPQTTINAEPEAKPAKDQKPAPEKLSDELYDARLAFLRDQRDADDEATQTRRAELIAALRAERPGDPAPILEQAIDLALQAHLASPFWGALGDPTKTKADTEKTTADVTPPDAEEPKPTPMRERLPAILALLDEARTAADPAAVSQFFGAAPVAAPGDTAARHALELEKKTFETTRELLAKIARLRADVLQGAAQLDEAWTAHTQIARWEAEPAKDTQRLTAALYAASDLPGLALAALNARLEDDPADAELWRERIALYRQLGWDEFADRDERTLALRAAQKSRLKF